MSGKYTYTASHHFGSILRAEFPDLIQNESPEIVDEIIRLCLEVWELNRDPGKNGPLMKNIVYQVISNM
jgi:hypothetical protein